MADAVKRILEVRGGEGSPPSISLQKGTAINPLSLGSAGSWRISGPGVLEIHGYLYFDGESLYVQSADETRPITINRRKVSVAWTEVQLPSAIEVGAVNILYQSDEPFEEGDPTIAQPLDTSSPSVASLVAAAKPNFRGAVARPPDDESTNFHPIAPGASGQLSAISGETDFGRPQMNPPMAGDAAPMWGDAQPPAMSPFEIPAMPPTGPEFAPMEPPVQAPPPAPEHGNAFMNRFVREWNSFSYPKRIALVIFPFALLSGYNLITDDWGPFSSPRPKGTAPRASARASASAMASARPSATALSTATSAPTITTPLTLPTATSGTATISKSPDAGAPPPASKKTTERQAVDLVHAGAYEQAAKLYDQLAQETKRTDYADMARLLRERAMRQN